MVKTSKSEQQAALASTMELYLATSVAVQEDPDLEDDSDMEDDGLIIDEGGDTEIFEALGFQAMQDGQEILGDGRRGPYGQQGKNNWFFTSLSAPAHDFRRLFQYELC